MILKLSLIKDVTNLQLSRNYECDGKFCMNSHLGILLHHLKTW